MLKDKRVLLVKKKTESDWTSCQSITRNIELSYRNIFSDENILVFNLDLSSNLFELAIEIEKIAQFKPDYIVWMDHFPNPLNFVVLAKIYFTRVSTTTDCPHFIFHVFGDFALQTPEWVECQAHLDLFKTTFFCASLAQKKLVDSFLKKGESYLVPFPSDPAQFYFSKDERISFREQYQLESDEFAMLYTGRISLQKNVIELIKCFAQAKTFLPSGTKFFFAGQFDDLNIPYIGLSGKSGSYQRYWEHSLGAILKDKDIVYLGNLDGQELRRAYNGCDLFISASTHNDEDYGMSPAEALMTGLHCLLTKWGGFQSFHDYMPEHVSMTPIKMLPGRILPDIVQLRKSIIMLLNKPLNSLDRESISRKSQKWLSIQSSSELIERFIEQSPPEKFGGFNRRLEKFAAYFTLSPLSPFKDADAPDYNKDFSSFYKAYFDHNSEEK
jgi:glycosyltransferase involved in cell wall biosynthesis